MKLEDAERAAANAYTLRRISEVLKRCDEQDAETQFGPSSGIGLHVYEGGLSAMLTPEAARLVRALVRQDMLTQRMTLQAEQAALGIEG